MAQSREIPTFVTSRVEILKPELLPDVLEILILEKFHKNSPRCFNQIIGFSMLGILELENEDGILGFSFPGGSRFSKPAGEGDKESQELPEDHQDANTDFRIVSILNFGIFPKNGKNRGMRGGGKIQERKNLREF